MKQMMKKAGNSPAGQKKYPFSADKHAHDIELVANRSFNLAQEALDRKDYDEYDRLMEMHEKADEVLMAIQSGMVNYKVAMLDGETLGKAKEMVSIASAIRDKATMQYNPDEPETVVNEDVSISSSPDSNASQEENTNSIGIIDTLIEMQREIADVKEKLISFNYDYESKVSIAEWLCDALDCRIDVILKEYSDKNDDEIYYTQSNGRK